MRDSNRLSAVKVAKLKEPGRYADGHGLYLQVSTWGTKAWIFRFMRDGRARHMGLGPLHTLTLAEARERARRARQSLLDGIDPIDQRDAAKLSARAESAKVVTFREAAERYLKAHRAGWKNPKHSHQWSATLTTYAYPIIGDLSVASIDVGHVTSVLEPIWETRTETASRVRGRIENVLSWALARGYRTGDNPARWRGHLDKLLPARNKVAKVKHHPAVPYADVPAFVAGLQAQPSLSASALEFTILTAARTGEVVGARWSEFDFASKIWTIPRERMKADREHRVPLSPRVLEILFAVPRIQGNPHVFPGAREGQSLSNMAMLELLRGLRGGGLTVHGFRSSFRDWCAEATKLPARSR